VPTSATKLKQNKNQKVLGLIIIFSNMVKNS